MTAPNLIGIVADDITGANDIGIMYAKAGYVTHVYSYDGSFALQSGQAQPDVIVLDTDSRFDTPEEAYRKVYAATKDLERAGCDRFINKTCSVGRGNVGPEFDAMLDALGAAFAVVVFGFPKNGRQTIEGIHYVHGRKLEESEFRNDPVHPMTRSDMAGILQAQTKRKTGLVTRSVVAQGADAVRQALDAKRAEGFSYIIVDVEDQQSLRTIAEAVQDEPVTAGASALSEELALVWGAKPVSEAGSGVAERPGLGVILAAGSLMPQTAAQVEAVRAAGTKTIMLEALRLFDEADREAELERIVTAMADHVRQGQDVLVHSPNEPEAVAAVKTEGGRRGLTNTAVSRLVSGAIAEIVARAMAATGQNRIVTAGGDTSASVCARLGVKGMRIWQEIAPGLPSCITLGDSPLVLVLKSGSFGKPDFLLQAADHVRSIKE